MSTHSESDQQPEISKEFQRLEQQRLLEDTVRSCQQTQIGKRYADEGASLSKIQGFDSELPKILEWLKKPRNFLVLFGPPGIGKTYLCAALIERILPRYSQSWRYWNEAKLLSHIRKSMEEFGEYTVTAMNATDDEFLMLDDIGSSKRNDWREEVLFSIIDSRYNSQKPTVLTGNLTMEELSAYHPRLLSRIGAKENCIINTSGCFDRRTS